MNVKEVDKLSAQFAVSISEATGLIASWLGDEEETNDSQQMDIDEDDDLGLTKLTNSRGGLGSTNQSSLPFRDPVFNLNPRVNPTVSTSKAITSHKALLALQKQVPKTQHQHQQRQELKSDSESDSEGRSSSIKTTPKRSSSSFLDSYKKNKKRR